MLTRLSHRTIASVLAVASGLFTGCGGGMATRSNVPANPVVNTMRAADTLAVYNGQYLVVRNEQVLAWGRNTEGKSVPPAGLEAVTSVAAGTNHSLAVLEDGTAKGWGGSYLGEADVPADLSGVVDVAAGFGASIALKDDGTVVTWGREYAKPLTGHPSLLSNAVAIDIGEAHYLALQADGRVVAWGEYEYRQSNVPDKLTDEYGVIHIAAGANHNLVLRADGSLVAWGDNRLGQCDVPADLTGVVAVAAGGNTSYALLQDGTVVSWGGVDEVQREAIPANVTEFAAGPGGWAARTSDGAVHASHQINYDALTHVRMVSGNLVVKTDGSLVPLFHQGEGEFPAVAESVRIVDGKPISQGGFHAITSDIFSSPDIGTPRQQVNALLTDAREVRIWGNSHGLNEIPSFETAVESISCAVEHCLALLASGEIEAWGGNRFGQTDIPRDLPPVEAIAAGQFHSLALLESGEVITWGQSPTRTPLTQQTGITDAVAIDVSGKTNAVLLADGTALSFEAVSSPELIVGPFAEPFVDIAAGTYYAVGILANGQLTSWKAINTYRELAVPQHDRAFVRISADYETYYAVDDQDSLVVFGDYVIPVGLADKLASP